MLSAPARAGLALQPFLTNLLAGIQIATAQPIRLDDAVIVEGEWGRVEEITSTYVVVKLWDWRRMILPLTYFINVLRGIILKGNGFRELYPEFLILTAFGVIFLVIATVKFKKKID